MLPRSPRSPSALGRIANSVPTLNKRKRLQPDVEDDVGPRAEQLRPGKRPYRRQEPMNAHLSEEWSPAARPNEYYLDEQLVCPHCGDSIGYDQAVATRALTWASNKHGKVEVHDGQPLIRLCVEFNCPSCDRTFDYEYAKGKVGEYAKAKYTSLSEMRVVIHGKPHIEDAHDDNNEQLVCPDCESSFDYKDMKEKDFVAWVPNRDSKVELLHDQPFFRLCAEFTCFSCHYTIDYIHPMTKDSRVCLPETDVAIQSLKATTSVQQPPLLTKWQKAARPRHGLYGLRYYRARQQGKMDCLFPLVLSRAVKPDEISIVKPKSH